MTKNLFLVGLLVAVGCASHPKTSTVSAPSPTPVAVSALPADIPDFIKELKGPPAKNSHADKADYRALKKFQKTRTKEDCERAATEVKISLASLYGAPYGPLTAAEVAQWSDFFQTVGYEADEYIHLAKRNFQRPRPYDSHPDLIPCIRKETSFSYPSGHAGLSRFYMHVLSEIYPQMHKELEKRANQIGLDRNLGGVHYPSDIRDGKYLGDKIYDYMVKNANLKNRIHEKMSEIGGVSKELVQ